VGLRAYDLRVRDATTLPLKAHNAAHNAAHTRLICALSAVDKDAAGYRQHNAANRDGGQNARPGERLAAIQACETTLTTLTLLNHQLGNRLL
jgi:hypothetical protein